MDDLIRVTVQYLHVLTGVLWIGGGLYTLFVQTPSLMSAPAQSRGPVLGQLIPRQVNYLLRLGEITIATGLINLFASGKARLLENVFSSRWGIAIVLGAAMAIALLILSHTVIKPAAMRLLEVGPKAAQGDPAASMEVPAILERLRRVGQAQIALGGLIILAMVIARFS
ncbi:MAG: hypothetical protein E6I57_01745 [Chloroflexi bacterium]